MEAESHGKKVCANNTADNRNQLPKNDHYHIEG